MQAENNAHVVLAVLVLTDYFLVVCVNEERQCDTVRAKGRLDNVRDVLLVCFLIEIFHGNARGLLVLSQVEVGAVSNAPQLAPAEREQELEVGGRLGIVRKLFRLVVAQTQVLVLHAEGQQELVAVILPVCEPLKVGTRLAEELKLHLLELAGTEGEVARGDLVAEGLADLANAERNLLTGSALNVLEVDKDTLCGLRTEIQLVLCVLGNALEGLEHKVELTDVRPVVLAAGRAGNLVLIDELLHLGLAQRVNALAEVEVILVAPVLDDLVGTEALLALLAVHQRVGETAYVTRGNPSHGVHENSGVEADVVRAFLYELLAPRRLDVVFELDAERTVVPGVRKAAVDLRAGVHEATALAQGNDFFHCFFAVVHFQSPFGTAGCCTKFFA